MALSYLGNFGTVEDIDTPTSSAEKMFARWYETTKKTLISSTKPNFALKRLKVAKVDEEIVFGFEYPYQRPADCLKVLGVGNIEDKANDFTVEGDRIYTDVEYEDGLPLRYVANIDSVNKFSSEFMELLALHLARNVCKDITEDTAMLQYIDSIIPIAKAVLVSLKSQENKPIRVSRSKFLASKTNTNPRWNEKK